MSDPWFMYKKSKTFRPINMYRELLASPALFKNFVYFFKKKLCSSHHLLGTGYILQIFFIA